MHDNEHVEHLLVLDNGLQSYSNFFVVHTCRYCLTNPTSRMTFCSSSALLIQIRWSTRSCVYQVALSTIVNFEE